MNIFGTALMCLNEMNEEQKMNRHSMLLFCYQTNHMDFIYVFPRVFVYLLFRSLLCKNSFSASRQMIRKIENNYSKL